MPRYEWFIDHQEDMHSAFTKPQRPGYTDSYIEFKVRPEEAEAVGYCTLTPGDARKLGKALIKAAKDAEA